MLRWFPNSKLLLHASHAALPILNSSKLPPVADAADLIIFYIIDKTIRNSKFRCLSEATPYHHNVFTFTLLLPEGRAGVAWEPSNKNDALCLLFFFGFKGLIKVKGHFVPTNMHGVVVWSQTNVDRLSSLSTRGFQLWTRYVHDKHDT
jgi:hypothetical protein